MSRPLFDEYAERAVLGAVVVRNGAMDDIADELLAEHFGREHHRLTFEAMWRLHSAGQPIDPLTLADDMGRAGTLEIVTKQFLFELGGGVPVSSNVTAYARAVRDKALLRSLRDNARKTLDECEAEVSTGLALLEDAEAAIYRMGARAVKGDWMSVGDLVAEVYPAMERMNNRDSAVDGLTTGFPELDEMTRGFQSSDLILLGARPSQGKTALALQVAMHAAQTVPVGFLSIEMSRQPLAMRGVIAQAQVNGWRVLSGFANDMEITRLGQGLSAFGALKLFIDDSPNVSPIQARSKIRRLQSKVGKLGLVVIDYLQLMAPQPEDRRENKTNQVAGISRALKLMAREFGAPMLVLSQLNRGLERTQDKTPSMSDLRDSGALEQDADLVLLLHRPEVYDRDNASLSGQAELIIGKQRNGPVGVVKLHFEKAQMRFESERRAS